MDIVFLFLSILFFFLCVGLNAAGQDGLSFLIGCFALICFALFIIDDDKSKSPIKTYFITTERQNDKSCIITVQSKHDILIHYKTEIYEVGMHKVWQLQVAKKDPIKIVEFNDKPIISQVYPC